MIMLVGAAVEAYHRFHFKKKRRQKMKRPMRLGTTSATREVSATGLDMVTAVKNGKMKQMLVAFRTR